MNKLVGDSTRNLVSFAVTQTADQNGVIQFSVAPDPTITSRGSVAGTAIRAVPEPASGVLVVMAGGLGLALRSRRSRER